MGFGIFFVLLIALGSGDEGTTLSDGPQPGSNENCPRACPLRQTFPFFNDSIQLPQDSDDHQYLRLRISRRNESEGEIEEDVPHLRVFIWPNTGNGNCSISGQLTNGVMRKKATFIVETAGYKEGLCLTATAEVDPLGNQSVWTLDPSRLVINSSASYNVTLEGNGTFEEWHMSTWLVVGAYMVFCVLFFLVWYLLVFPGTCL